MNVDSIKACVERYKVDGRTGMVMPLDVVQALLDRIDERQESPEAPHPGTQISGATTDGQDLPPCTDNTTLREKIAHQVHADWSRWMKYMFRCGQMLDDGRFVMDANKVSRWKRQMTTPYEQLTCDDRKSDVAIAHRYLKLMAGCD